MDFHFHNQPVVFAGSSGCKSFRLLEGSSARKMITSWSSCSCFSSPRNEIFSSLSSNATGFFPLRNVWTRRSVTLGAFSKSIRCRTGLCGRARPNGSSKHRVLCGLFPTDPWSPTVDSQSIASQLFAVSLFPYIGFLYYITKSKTAPKLTLFGFYFLLAFVGATIPAGIYAKVRYGTSLSNVDWLHGGAESLLVLTNLFIVLGLRGALRRINGAKKAKPKSTSEIVDKQSSV
ncbi:hypothetical protein HPP92_028307 [Vanilla planifolia]|uniref:Uncharacterized protein n=1 Tax=Vanilla planifolia TaxID=51239 RepID=A0A835PBI2_VANPL|nr:hypothetical protein HPP92_028307 [Vanilla planifolia]